MVERVADDFDHQQEQEDGDGGGRHRLVLAVAVRMILIRRLPCGAHADQPGHVRRGVGQRVEAVRQDADRTARVAERDLGDRHGQVEQQDAKQHARDRRISVGAEG